MSDYTHTTITLSCPHAQDSSRGCAIDAYVTENGLCYHKSHYSDHNGPLWSVTHVLSGLVLGKYAGAFMNEYQCRSFIARIADLADWTQARPEISDEIKAAINAEAQACQRINYTPVF